MIRVRIALAPAALAVALAVAVPAQAAPIKLAGTVGPGFTITLTKLGKKVTLLKPGTYSIAVVDRSNIHNFHLRGPGVNKEITQIGFVGTKTMVVTLKRGTYTFVCDPHFTTMRGSFKVA